MKNPNDPNGNRTRNLLACSAVPQTAPLRIPSIYIITLFIIKHINILVLSIQSGYYSSGNIQGF